MIYYLSIITLLLTASLVYHNYRYNKNILFLATYLCTLSLYTLVHAIVYNKDSSVAIAIFYRHFSPFYSLAGGMLFLYIKHELNRDKGWESNNLWHFTPSLIEFINLLPYFFTPFALKIDLANSILATSDFSKLSDKYLLYPISFSPVIRSFLFIAYVGATLHLLKKHKKQHPKALKASKHFKWLKFVVLNALVFAICSIIIAILYYAFKKLIRTEINTDIFVILAGLSFIIIPIVMLFYPNLAKEALPSSVPPKNNLPKPIPDVKKEEADKIAAQIIDCFENQKPYLHKDFSLDSLSTILNIPKYQLYNSFNVSLNKKFTQMRASYRIEYSKQLLAEEELDKVSMEGIWLQAGFASKSNFFTTFKEETGLTPTEYLEKIKDQTPTS